jgi:arginyl-tRNA synthetase
VFLLIEKRLQAAVSAHLLERYGLATPVSVEQPKQSDFGEMALPVAFQLARELRKPPKSIALVLVAGLSGTPGVAGLEVAGNGYINVRFDRGYYAAGLLDESFRAPANRAEKIIVEHTNINPNKAAHIGHLRNAVLGDTFVRMLRSRGLAVEVQNYIDNTGVQVADVVVGFHYLEHRTASEVQALIADPSVRFDYLCWDLYAHVSVYYDTHPPGLARRPNWGT